MDQSLTAKSRLRTRLRFPRLRALFLVAPLSAVASSALADMAQPKLVFDGTETYKNNGLTFTRYKLRVTNADSFAPELFAPAPDLSPCGGAAKSPRSWIEIYEGNTRLTRFCDLSKPSDLSSLWFGLPPGVRPPRWVYIEILDRKTDQAIASNPVTIPRKDTAPGNH